MLNAHHKHHTHIIDFETKHSASTTHIDLKILHTSKTDHKHHRHIVDLEILHTSNTQHKHHTHCRSEDT